MNTTSVSLLEQLRHPLHTEDNRLAWRRFVQLYTPLIYRWARRLGSSQQDATDLTQEVFTLMVRKLPEFAYDRQKSFRAWLRTVTINKWRDIRRRRTETPIDETVLAELESHDTSGVFEETEYRQYLVKRALELMQAEFQPVTWKACWEYMVVDRPAGEVARELGITVNAVYLAKSRVLSRLRKQLEGLLE